MSQSLDRRAHRVALMRAVAAVLWAVVLLLALHGHRTVTGADIPVLAGLLVAAYPLIDIAALVAGPRSTPQLRTAILIDGVAVIALLGATLALNAGAVLVAFGAWALVSGLVQLVNAWQAEGSRRAQLPLIVSGAISTLAGISFAAMASQDVAHVGNLAAYAIFGAFFFLVWALITGAKTSGPAAVRAD